MAKIVLREIKDKLASNWWYHVKSARFEIDTSLDESSTECDVDVDDVLIHKQQLPGDQYPIIKYHVILDDGTPHLVSNKEVKDMLAKKLVAFIDALTKLPPRCKFIRKFRNGNVQVDFKLPSGVKFALKIDPRDCAAGYIDDSVLGSGPGGTTPRPRPRSTRRKVYWGASYHEVADTPIEAIFGQLSEKTRRKVARAIDMLRSQQNMLHIKSSDHAVNAIVKSQTDEDIEYATCIGEDGRYYCVSNTLDACLGMQGTICKHIILTVLAAAKDGRVPREVLSSWIQATLDNEAVIDPDEATTMFCECKNGPLELGKGWRDVTILPEDLVAF